jgi:hypothetical protein
LLLLHISSCGQAMLLAMQAVPLAYTVYSTTHRGCILYCIFVFTSPLTAQADIKQARRGDAEAGQRCQPRQVAQPLKREAATQTIITSIAITAAATATLTTLVTISIIHSTTSAESFIIDTIAAAACLHGASCGLAGRAQDY